MAFSQYPDSIAVIISDGSPFTIELSGVTPTANQQLSVYRMQIFKRGLQPNVTMRVKAYIAGVLKATSEAVAVSQIESEYSATDNFYGWVNFNFSPRYNFNLSAETKFQLELSNYTFTEGLIYIGAVLDWPVTMGFNAAPGSVNSSPVAIELYGAS